MSVVRTDAENEPDLEYSDFILTEILFKSDLTCIARVFFFHKYNPKTTAIATIITMKTAPIAIIIFFLIPIDDEALKRHLSIESQYGSKEADEFLRKFFNVHYDRFPNFTITFCYPRRCFKI